MNYEMKSKPFDLLKELGNILQPIKYTNKLCLGCGARIPEYLDDYEYCTECQLINERKLNNYESK